MLSSTTINTIGHPFIQLKTVPSTNTYLMQMVQNGLAKHGYTVFAHEQTAGKGQRGKVWDTKTDSNIIVSVALDMSFLQLNNQFLLSIMTSLAVHDFFSSYAGEDTKIKWPNDIYWQNRKAGGILIENIIRGNQWNWAILGIGININQTKFENAIRNPVSLKQITGKSFDTIELTKQLCTCLENRFRQLMSPASTDFLQMYNQQLYKLKQQVILKKENVNFNCTIEGVSLFGDLLTSDGSNAAFTFGEVEWVF